MSNAIKAHGTLLKAGDGAATEVFTTVAEVTSLGGPGITLETSDVTSHDSPAGWREFIGTLLDGGEVSLSINFIPSNTTQNFTNGLGKDQTDRTLRNFKLVFPDTGATTWSFTALVTSYNPSEPVEEKLSADITLKLSGQPTLS